VYIKGAIVFLTLSFFRSLSLSLSLRFSPFVFLISLYFWFFTFFSVFSFYFSVSISVFPLYFYVCFTLFSVLCFYFYFIPVIPVLFQVSLSVTFFFFFFFFFLLLLLLLILFLFFFSLNLSHSFLQCTDYIDGRQPTLNILPVTASFKISSSSRRFAVASAFIPGWVALVQVATDVTEKRNLVQYVRKSPGLWTFRPTEKEEVSFKFSLNSCTDVTALWRRTSNWRYWTAASFLSVTLDGYKLSASCLLLL